MLHKKSWMVFELKSSNLKDKLRRCDTQELAKKNFKKLIPLKP
jgi:hypothetical protein